MNIKEIRILSEAIDDLEEGRKFYGHQGMGLGAYFLDSLYSDIESLFIYAGIHSRKYGFRRMLSKKFPYAIYYYIKDRVAYVIAVLPMRRDPLWMERKIKDRG